VKLPRDLSGADVIRALERAGFTVLRQSGSQVRLGKNEVCVTVPDYKTIAPGTLKSILKQAGLAVEDLVEKP
jgi:predicted RNA binding protein YcfA (HicA-like mRNA interferase family)